MPVGCSDGVKRDEFHRLLTAAISRQVCFPCNRERVFGCLVEEVAQADTVDAADIRQCRKRGDHAIGFEFGEECSRKSGLDSQPGKGKMLLRSKRAKLHANTVRLE